MKLWSALSKRTQSQYRKENVTPQRYNAWNRTSRKSKERLKKQGVDRDTFLTAPNTRTAQLQSFRQRAISRLLSLLPRANASAIRINVGLMDPSQIQIALRANQSKLRHLASIQRDGEGVEFVYDPKKNADVNPFWYH